MTIIIKGWLNAHARSRKTYHLVLWALMGIAATACAEEDPNWMPEVTPGNAPQSYSPNVRSGYPDQVYFGDTHVHTNLSNDAYAMGNHTLGPNEAYRFAKGEVVTTHSGMKTRLRRPLDFLMVADHAINMGVMAREHEVSVYVCPGLTLLHGPRVRWRTKARCRLDVESCT